MIFPRQKLLHASLVGVFAILFSLSIGYVSAEWSIPSNSGAQPNLTPLLPSGGASGKSGRLIVNTAGDAGSMGLRIAGGRLVIGSTSNIGQNLAVGMEGNVRATSYCDANGSNCVDANRLQNIAASIPLGAIAPFANPCPGPAWQEYIPLRGRYPYGNSTSGVSGGDSHAHGRHNYYIISAGGPDIYAIRGSAYQINDAPYYSVQYCKKVAN